MNKQTERHNARLSDRSKYLPMVICPREESTERLDDRWVRPAKDGENPSLHKEIKPLNGIDK